MSVYSSLLKIDFQSLKFKSNLWALRSESDVTLGGYSTRSSGSETRLSLSLWTTQHVSIVISIFKPIQSIVVFYTGLQAANLAAIFVATSVDLDRRRYIGGMFWSANLTPGREHFFPLPLLCKSEPSMCQHLCEVGGGVNDLHCCATHSRGVLKPRNSWSQQSVHHSSTDIKMNNWTAAEIQEMLASPRSL